MTWTWTSVGELEDKWVLAIPQPGNLRTDVCAVRAPSNVLRIPPDVKDKKTVVV
jgi:hypothetical protein